MQLYIIKTTLCHQKEPTDLKRMNKIQKTLPFVPSISLSLKKKNESPAGATTNVAAKPFDLTWIDPAYAPKLHASPKSRN